MNRHLPFALLLLWAAAALAQTPPPPMQYTTVAAPPGGADALARLFAARQRPATDVTAALQAGRLDLAAARVLILGSYTNSDAQVRATLAGSGPALERWLQAGGVLVQFGQQDALEKRTDWLPGGLLATRADPDYGDLRWLRPDHPLATTPQRLTEAELAQWRYERWPIAWEAITGWDGFECILAAGPRERAAAVVEAAVGRGRVLVMAVSPDSFYQLGDGETPRLAERFFDNLLHYLDELVAGRGVKLTPRPALAAVRPVTPPVPVQVVTTTTSPLPELLRASGAAPSRLAAVPDRAPTGVVLLDARLAERLTPAQATALRQGVEGGGVVVELHQNLDWRPAWLPAELRAARGGMPADEVAATRLDDPLFATPNPLAGARAGAWREAPTAFARQGLSGVLGWSVLARYGGPGAPAAVVARRLGRGLVVLVSADFTAVAAASGLPADNARAFLANLLAACRAAQQNRYELPPPPVLPERGKMVPGRQVDGSVMTATEQILRPAGRQVEFPGRPIDLDLLPGGRLLAVVDRQHLRVVDVASGDEVASAAGDGGHSVTGLAITRDGRRLFTSSVKGHVQEWTFDGRALRAGQKRKVPGGVSAGLLLSADEGTLYAACSKGNQLVALPLAAGEPRPVAVGVAPFEVIRAAGKLYVSNWGGPRAKPGERVADTSGTPVVVDERTVAIRGSVHVLRETDLSVVAEVEVGRLPSGLAASPDGRRVYVANANSDTVSVLDTALDQVVETIPVRPVAALPFGSATNALAVSPDGARLYVCCGTNNAVAQVTLSAAARGSAGPPQSTVDGFIPVGWYPGAVAVRADGGELYVANIKGYGSLAAAERHNSHQHLGTLSLVPTPTAAELAELTRRTAANNRLTTALAGVEPPRPGVAPVPLPERHGEPSPLRHVIYIIRENRTYDQVFGDLEQGNGDPELVHFGREVTPNAHALAEQFVLLDNFHCSGVLSADGHQWTDEAYVTGYLERMFGGFFRSYPYEGSDALAYSPGGFLWDNALDHGLTFRSYGEMVQARITPLQTGQRATFKAIYDDFLDNGRMDSFTIRATAKIARVQQFLCPTVIGFPGTVPDIYRASEFIRELREFEQTGSLPNLCLLLLPNDHTSGTSPGMPTPRAAVADNDLALGRIVEAVTHSKFWPSTAIVVCEDDPQAGVDHVDGHRSPALVISPYTPRGQVVSELYTQVGLVKTIELLLGLPPMNQLDLSAEPLRACFTAEADLTPYTALPNRVPLDELNPPRTALAGEALRWAIASEAENLAEIDEADEDTLNRILWHYCKGYETPYPSRYSALSGASARAGRSEDR